MGEKYETSKAEFGLSGPVWHPFWPKPFKAGWVVASAGFTFISYLAFSFVWSGILSGDYGLVVGGTAGGLMMLLFGVGFLSIAGLELPGISRSIYWTTGSAFGPGTKIAQKSNLVMVTGTFSTAFYALSAAVVQVLGTSESLLPVSKSNIGGGIVAAVFGTFILLVGVAMLLLRECTDVVLTVDGIGRQTLRRRAWRSEQVDVFVRWDDISDLKVETFDVTTGMRTAHFPIIRIVAQGLDANRRLLLMETPESTIVRLQQINVEPNSFFALLLWCTNTPSARIALGTSAVRELLKPPSLLERFRLSNIAINKRHWWSTLF